MFLGFGERGSDFEKQVFLAEKKANKAKAEHNKNASEFFASPEKELSSELNEAVETAANKLSENTEELKALVEASFPDRTEQEREQILTQLQSVEGRTKFKGFIKNYIFQALPIDITVGSVAGFIAPILARMALKNSARVFLASKTFGVSVAAGAIASAIVEPIRHWWSNRKKIVAKDIEWQLDAAEKSSDQAAIVAKAQKDLHAGKFRKEDEASVKKLLQDQIVKLHLETNQEKIEGLSEKDKVLQILKMSQGARRELLTAGGREARRIINKIEFLTEKNKVTVKELAGAALKGAFTGALGGALGGAIHTWVIDNGLGAKALEVAGEKLRTVWGVVKNAKGSGGKGTTLAFANPILALHLFETVKAENPLIPNEQIPEIVQQVVENKSEQSFALTGESLQQFQEQLAEQEFEASLEKGDGATNLARKVIHDYLVNLAKAGDPVASNMTTEQMLYAEDWFIKNKMEKYVEGGLNHAFQLGEETPPFAGQDAKESVEQALKLNSGQLENLKQFSSQLSPKTVNEMHDLNKFYDNANDYSKGLEDKSKIVPESKEQVEPKISKSPDANPSSSPTETPQKSPTPTLSQTPEKSPSPTTTQTPEKIPTSTTTPKPTETPFVSEGEDEGVNDEESSEDNSESLADTETVETAPITESLEQQEQNLLDQFAVEANDFLKEDREIKKRNQKILAILAGALGLATAGLVAYKIKIEGDNDKKANPEKFYSPEKKVEDVLEFLTSLGIKGRLGAGVTPKQFSKQYDNLQRRFKQFSSKNRSIDDFAGMTLIFENVAYENGGYRIIFSQNEIHLSIAIKQPGFGILLDDIPQDFIDQNKEAKNLLRNKTYELVREWNNKYQVNVFYDQGHQAGISLEQFNSNAHKFEYALSQIPLDDLKDKNISLNRKYNEIDSIGYINLDIIHQDEKQIEQQLRRLLGLDETVAPVTENVISGEENKNFVVIPPIVDNNPVVTENTSGSAVPAEASTVNIKETINALETAGVSIDFEDPAAKVEDFTDYIVAISKAVENDSEFFQDKTIKIGRVNKIDEKDPNIIWISTRKTTPEQNEEWLKALAQGHRFTKEMKALGITINIPSLFTVPATKHFEAIKSVAEAYPEYFKTKDIWINNRDDFNNPDKIFIDASRKDSEKLREELTELVKNSIEAEDVNKELEAIRIELKRIEDKFAVKIERSEQIEKYLAERAEAVTALELGIEQANLDAPGILKDATIKLSDQWGTPSGIYEVDIGRGSMEDFAAFFLDTDKFFEAQEIIEDSEKNNSADLLFHTKELTIASIEPREKADFFKDNKVEIHGEPFYDRELTLADLNKAGLEPKYDIKIGDTEIRVSSPYRLSENRIAVTAYVKEGNAFVARSFYRSNSSGLWRYLPSYLKDGEGGLSWYDKAMSEEAITAPSEMQQALAYLSKDETGILEVDNPDFLFAGTARDLYNRISDPDNNVVGTIQFEVNKESFNLRGHFSAAGKSKINPEKIEFADSAYKPDFNKKVNSWQQTSNLYALPGKKQGMINVDLFESKNGELRYVYCTDELDRTWIAAVETTTKVGSTGLREQWVAGGDLTTPAYEYYSQTGGSKNANDELWNGSYVDMYKNYVSKIPLIQEYLAWKEGEKAAVPAVTPEVKSAVEYPKGITTSVGKKMWDRLHSSEPGKNIFEMKRYQEAIPDLEMIRNLIEDQKSFKSFSENDPVMQALQILHDLLYKYTIENNENRIESVIKMIGHIRQLNRKAILAAEKKYIKIAESATNETDNDEIVASPVDLEPTEPEPTTEKSEENIASEKQSKENTTDPFVIYEQKIAQAELMKNKGDKKLEEETFELLALLPEDLKKYDDATIPRLQQFIAKFYGTEDSLKKWTGAATVWFSKQGEGGKAVSYHYNEPKKALEAFMRSRDYLRRVAPDKVMKEEAKEELEKSPEWKLQEEKRREARAVELKAVGEKLIKELPESQELINTEYTKKIIEYIGKFYDNAQPYDWENEYNQGAYITWLKNLGPDAENVSWQLNRPKKALETFMKGFMYQYIVQDVLSKK